MLILLYAFAAGALVLFGDNVLVIGLCVVIGGLLLILCDAWRPPQRWTEKQPGKQARGNSPFPTSRQ